MDKNFKGTPEEYIEFRKRRNKANEKYYSKPNIREKKKVYSKEYRIKNKQKIFEYFKQHRSKPETKARVKLWNELNKEHRKQYTQTKEYKAKKKISDRKYRLKNKDKLIPKVKQYRKDNPDKVKKWYDKYNHSPKGRIYQHNQNHLRIASRKKRQTDLTKERIKEILNRDKVCVYCGSDYNLELDHIIPLKKGGSCMSNNFVVACEKCNCRKSGKDVFNWCKENNKEVPSIVLELIKSQSLGI